VTRAGIGRGCSAVSCDAGNLEPWNLNTDSVSWALASFPFPLSKETYARINLSAINEVSYRFQRLRYSSRRNHQFRNGFGGRHSPSAGQGDHVRGTIKCLGRGGGMGLSKRQTVRESPFSTSSSQPPGARVESACDYLRSMGPDKAFAENIYLVR
jgi:hypothetical protein